jgi:MoaA/NifB/PqqE/SkfB family radical SAM enzyme
LKTEEAFQVIDNLAEIGTSVLLLTGGEPFVRSDLPRLVKRVIDKGMHPRIQTNGLATKSDLQECAKYGVRDISISLDSLHNGTQDFLNGGFASSWSTAINTVSNVSQTLGTDTFAAFGCVFSPYNFTEVTKVIEFATEIGWWVSLVPAHSTDLLEPRSFSTFNSQMEFSESEYDRIDEVVLKIKQMKKDGYHIYDSDQYIDDLQRFVKKQPITWRNRNNNICDAGSLYFAVLPDGSMAPCCDWRLAEDIKVSSKNFPNDFQNRKFDASITKIARACSGCMYGSYPEISISARFAKAAMERVRLFITEDRAKIKNYSAEELEKLAIKISKAS